MYYFIFIFFVYVWPLWAGFNGMAQSEGSTGVAAVAQLFTQMSPDQRNELAQQMGMSPEQVSSAIFAMFTKGLRARTC